MVERMDVEPNPKKAPFPPTLKIPPSKAWGQDLSKFFYYNKQRCNYKTNSSDMYAGADAGMTACRDGISAISVRTYKT
jgi:hypothetical protein